MEIRFIHFNIMFRPHTALERDSPKDSESFGDQEPTRCRTAIDKNETNECQLPSPSPRRAPRCSHPFMKDMLGGSPSPFATASRMVETLRQRLLKLPESSMDNIYQPISIYCCKNKTEEQIPKIECSNDEEGSESHYESILKACEQLSPIPIDSIFNGVKDVEKIGEGVYGEVYSGTFRFFNQASWVYKIVAIEGTMIVNGERQKRFSEVLPEIIVSQELSKLRHGLNNCFTDGFVYMKNARIAKGKYPGNLVKSWETFHEKYESDNDKPDFPPEQLYMVLEFEFAGQDIESLNFNDACQTVSIVMQVAHTLAVGETALEFEHRDLHWGNILVEKTEELNVSFTMNGVTYLVPAAGIKAVVIDFTVSRITQPSTGKSVFLDLGDDEEQFLGTGDHQFDIYRMMRDHNRNDWNEYSPKSNVFWLHYLANKLFVKGRYSSGSRKNPDHKEAIRKLRDLSYAILEFSSAKDFVLSDDCKNFRQFLSSCSRTLTQTPSENEK